MVQETIHSTGARPGYGGGFSFVKGMLVIAMVGALFSLGSATLPKLYECYLLRDLADRVAHLYGSMPMEEVQRRVNHEQSRSRISLSESSFRILPVGHGYRVTVRHPIPLTIQMGEETLSLKGHERWTCFYEVET